jgi:ABC-2 type transport system permease protein
MPISTDKFSAKSRGEYKESILRIARKELAGFFSSLTAYIFLGVFLAFTLFIFFWVDTFFARNIADVRPIFEWMPLLLVFLVPSITMRMWSEERRSGTLEFLLTMPLSNLELVLGKFLACLALVAIALLLTLPIPISVALLGSLDWGPVFGGYLAALFLAAAYAAIGLFISARSDNQIVSLILSALICGLFLLIGSESITSLFSSSVGETLKLFGSGSRFQSITRGVIDFRDLYYYTSVAAVFLSLNVLGLERLRWAGNRPNANHRNWEIVTALCVANFIAGNFWLQQIGWARADLTQGKIYSISTATRNYLAQLKEPLLIRGYFSKKTHPLLAPLVPALRDLIKEYAIAGQGKVRVEFVDPLEKPELEKEAAEKYGINPVVFQTKSKYQAALTNSFFDVLVLYGDQYQKLSFRDLVDVKAHGDTDVEVELKDPEYDITSAIKKVLLGYQTAGNPFLNIEEPVSFVGYISPDNRLPEPLKKLRAYLEEILTELKKQSNGKLTVQFVDPEADGGKVGKQIESEYGFRPMAISIFGGSFWFYMTFKSGHQLNPVALPREVDKAALERAVKATLKRFSKGFLKTVGILTPQPGVSQSSLSSDQNSFANLKAKLAESYSVEDVNLVNDLVPADVDLLLLIAPDKFNEKQVFAVDQFLMKGGTVIIASGAFDNVVGRSLTCRRTYSGLDEWFKHQGIEIQPRMVLDPRCASLPIPMERNVGGFPIQEVQFVPYPFLIDLRQDGMKASDSFTAGLQQLTVSWPSPIVVDVKKNSGRKVISILESSADAWTTDDTNVEPDFKNDEKLGFKPGKDAGKKMLAVAIEGRFESFFAGKKSPFSVEANQPASGGRNINPAAKTPAASGSAFSNVIEHSPPFGRIILFSSNSFLSDRVMMLESAGTGGRYVVPIEALQDCIDWSLEDHDLLSIRGRRHIARTLMPLSQGAQTFVEYLNYTLALLGVGVIWLIRRQQRIKATKGYRKFLLTLSSAAKAGELQA